MRRVLLIANPSASGFTGARFREVVSVLSRSFEITPAWPGGPEESQHSAAEAAAAGYYAVVAMGGDGVVHHVANGLIDTGTALGVIPAGTTNVFARIVGLPSNPGKAARALTEAEPVATSMVHVATESPIATRSTYATFAVGVGFDADVVSVAERRPYSKVHFGSIHYAKAAAGRLFGSYRRRPANLRVECAGQRVDAVAVLVQVHTPYTYFGALPLRITTGHVEGPAAIAIERLSALKAAEIVARAASGRRLDNAAGVHLFAGFEKLIIEADPTSPFQADGELLGQAGSIEVSPATRALLVLAPGGARDEPFTRRGGSH